MAKSDERFSDKVLDDDVLEGGVLDDSHPQASGLDDAMLAETPAEDAALDGSSPNESSAERTETGESAGVASDDPFDSPAVLRQIFATGSREEQAKALGRMLSFAPWDEIWSHIDRHRARELFPEVELPDSLRAAWGRYLGIADTDS